jgi:hypothetical protein
MPVLFENLLGLKWILLRCTVSRDLTPAETELSCQAGRSMEANISTTVNGTFARLDAPPDTGSCACADIMHLSSSLFLQVCLAVSARH